MYVKKVNYKKNLSNVKIELESFEQCCLHVYFNIILYKLHILKFLKIGFAKIHLMAQGKIFVTIPTVSKVTNLLL